MIKLKCPNCNKKLKEKHRMGISCERYDLYKCPKCEAISSEGKRIKDLDLLRKDISIYDQKNRIENMTKKIELIRTLEGHKSWVESVAVSPDQNYVISGSDDKTVKVWELETGNLVRTLKRHKDSVKSVAVSPDGKYVVSGSIDRTVKVWKLATGKLIQTLKGHEEFKGNYFRTTPKEQEKEKIS